VIEQRPKKSIRFKNWRRHWRTSAP